MAVDPQTLTDAKLVRQLMKNADAKGMGDLVLQCQVRIAELAGQEYDDALEREFWRAVTVAEELATKQNGKTTRLSRTRQKAARAGVVQCLIDWALSPKTTQGFQILVEKHPELTGEAIVVRHPDRFPSEAVESARAKLAAHGVQLS